MVSPCSNSSFLLIFVQSSSQLQLIVFACGFRYSWQSLVEELGSSSSGVYFRACCTLPWWCIAKTSCEVRGRCCKVRDTLQLHIAVRVWSGKIFEDENGSFTLKVVCLIGHEEVKPYELDLFSWFPLVSHMCTHASLHWKMSLKIGIRILSSEIGSPHSGL